MIYLCNGISSSMLRDPNLIQINYGLSEKEFVEIIQNTEFHSVIGHQELAHALTNITRTEIPFNRQSIRVNHDDMILLVSLNGRLPEHTRNVNYNGKLNYTFVRFEKQTGKDFANTISKIHEIMEAV